MRPWNVFPTPGKCRRQLRRPDELQRDSQTPKLRAAALGERFRIKRSARRSMQAGSSPGAVGFSSSRPCPYNHGISHFFAQNFGSNIVFYFQGGRNGRFQSTS